MAFIVWTGVEEWLTESATVDLSGGGLSAMGVQLGAEPVPFRVDYRLETPKFVTREIEVTAQGEGWRRHLILRHDGSGTWDTEVSDEGDVPGGPWDGSLPDLSEALDIDLENSPLTNTMPILRHGFQREGSGDFVMAFITTPSLRVEASPQRYEHLRTAESGSIVRYISRDGDFTADLELDSAGLLVHYPRLARRVEPGLRAG
ncbi:MAG TPA: putative glycolipid-binding domain-containing protein [Solirubrobacterales bacterium]|nr:putative glycolipid-binding domain-containing protein [Solirubrobacterales bacterium]